MVLGTKKAAHIGGASGHHGPKLHKLVAVQIIAGALDGLAIQPRLLSHAGTFGAGYGVALFPVTGHDDARRYAAVCEQNHKERLAARRAKEDLWVWLARLSLEIFVFQGHPLQGLPDDLPDELTKQTAGAFVSLHKDDRLRGCLGTISPTWEITAMGIVQNAISAGTRDPQFPPVRAGEPDELEYRRAGQARVGGLSRPAEPEAIRRYCQLREQARAAAGSGWSGHGGTTAGDCPAEGQYRGGRALYHPTFPGGATHMSAECTLCFHRCILREGQTGLCRVRTNWGDSIIPLNYGKLTALALDPIEKKNRRAAFIPVT